MSITLGIDPGLTGAIAALFDDGSYQVCDLPAIRDGKLSWIDGCALQSWIMVTLNGRPARAAIERVSAMPRQGVSSAFNFGCGFGSVLSVLQAAHLPIDLVTSAAWKRALGLSSDKHASLDKARLLFPSAELSRAKHDGRAEALLIAHYARKLT